MKPGLDWLFRPPAAPDETARGAAEARQRILTKPAGALGRLETLAVHMAALQGTQRPCADRVHIAVFAADHGVAAESISVFPQAVTGEMVRNFARGGAAICVMARALGATLDVHNLGVVNDPGPLDGVSRAVIAPSTANFTDSPAMSDEQLGAALAAGRGAAQRARDVGAHLFVGGEMGIGNTTAAAAIACALLDVAPEQMTGAGTGLSARGVAHKIRVIERALDRHRERFGTPLDALRCLGGFEIAALAGSYIACAQTRLPVMVDGFIATTAALVATRCCAGTSDWLLYSHVSAELGHRRLLAALRAEPILDLGMRLGEGTGAAAAVPLLRLACALHNNMATFADAGVSEKSE